MTWSALSSRERVLVVLVGGAVFVLFNLVLINALLKRNSRVRTEMVMAQAEIATLEVLAAERELWATRDEWLTKNLPVLENESAAGVALLDRVRGLATASGAGNLERPDLSPGVERTELYKAVSVTFETRSTWAALITFLHALQQPESFIVVDRAEIQIDPNDPAKMYGQFKVSKWFGPAGG